MSFIRTIHNPVHTAQYWEMEALGEGYYKALLDEYLIVRDRKGVTLYFKFPKGATTNFASVPKFADNLLGIDPIGKHAMGSAIHDLHYGWTGALYRDIHLIITSKFELRRWGFKVSVRTLAKAYGNPDPKHLRKTADLIYLNNMRHLGVSVLSRYTQYLAIRLFGAKFFHKTKNNKT